MKEKGEREGGGKERGMEGGKQERKKEQEKNRERKENVMINGFLFYLSLGKTFPDMTEADGRSYTTHTPQA